MLTARGSLKAAPWPTPLPRHEQVPCFPCMCCVRTWRAAAIFLSDTRSRVWHGTQREMQPSPSNAAAGLGRLGSRRLTCSMKTAAHWPHSTNTSAAFRFLQMATRSRIFWMTRRSRCGTLRTHKQVGQVRVAYGDIGWSSDGSRLLIKRGEDRQDGDLVWVPVPRLAQERRRACRAGSATRSARRDVPQLRGLARRQTDRGDASRQANFDGIRLAVLGRVRSDCPPARCSFKMQKSITTARPARRAFSAAASFTTPSCIQMDASADANRGLRLLRALLQTGGRCPRCLFSCPPEWIPGRDRLFRRELRSRAD